jgi:hypothetical protein
MDVNSFAPCGLICSLCKDSHGECRGCRYGGGDQNCYQLKCCKAKGIAGCWECETFPCGQGYLGDEKWKGVITAFAKCVREDGAENFYEIVKLKLGNAINYHDCTSMPEEKILAILRGKE